MSALPETHDLSHLLPARGITVRPPRVEGGTLGLIVLLAAFLAGLVGGLAPGILNDIRIRGDAVAAPDVAVREAHCRTWVVLRFCSAVLEGPENAQAPQTVRYAFFGGTGHPPAKALRHAADPARVGTDLGVATAWNRLLTLALFTGALAGCLGIALGAMRRSLALRRAFAAMSGRRLVPVVVDVERNNRLPPRHRLWVYSHEAEGRRERIMAEWPSAWRPLFTTGQETQALAVRAADGGVPMLLDGALNGIDLTQDEKVAFHAAFRATFGIPVAQARAAV